MTSQKQLAANRINALGGGVKTPDGKAISKHNALKHGLLSGEILLKGENKQSLDKLRQELFEELNPATELEALLVDRIVSNTWRLRRVLEVERNAMEWQKEYKSTEFNIDFGIGLSEEKESEEDKLKQQARKRTTNMVVNNGMDQILRYETTIERSIYKALHELQRLQAARQGEKPPLPVAIDVTIDRENDENKA